MYDLTTITQQSRTAALPAVNPSILSAILGRIEEAIETETTGIRTDIGFDIAASNARKSRHLYELSRAMKGMSAESLGVDHRQALSRLRGKLEDNERAIRAHMNAVSEIANLLQETIRRNEADGTYSESQFGRAG